MEHDEQIREALRDMAGRFGPMQTMLAKVKSVDEDEKTCVLIEEIGEDELEIPDVRLRPVAIDDNGLIIFPKADTYVLAARIENDEEWMVIAVDEADKIKWTVGTCKFEVDDGFLIKKGDNTLKDIIQMIIEAVQQIVVVYGNNPDYTKLASALTKLNLVLK